MTTPLRADRNVSSRITVVMATYNGEKYVEEQFKSLLNQELLPSEIIVSDDGSSDRTLPIIRDLLPQAGCAPRVRVIENAENLGFGGNFLTAASVATTELVAFCDQDDIWRADKLAKTEAAFTDPSAVLCVHPASTIDGTAAPIGEFTQGIRGRRTRGPLTHDPWGVFYGFSMTFRRSLLDLHPFRQRPVDYISGKGRMGHDRWIQFLANIAGDTIELDEPLIAYRQHGQNLYGAGVRPAEQPLSRQAAIARGRIYADAARDCRAILDQLDPAVSRTFPRLNLQKAVRFWDKVVEIDARRLALYEARSRLSSLSLFLSNLRHQTYKDVADHKFRLKAAVKDGLIAAFN